MTNSLTLAQARKLVLLSQRLPAAKQGGSATAATLAAIEHLGYVQIDTISAIQRAHHHTLWSRNPRYEASQLDTLLSAKKVFEYWSHAAAYLPMCDYRYSLPRKHAIASGDQTHWYKRDQPLMRAILKRISDEGPLMAKDFEHSGTKLDAWSTKPAKRALECLFIQGDLMISNRINFHKVYDLTERVLPTDINTIPPSPEEYARFHITRYLQTNGLGQLSEMSYLLKNIKPLLSATLQEMVAGGEVELLDVAGMQYHALPSSLALLNKPLARGKLAILSPFDNLLIQRKRMQTLFNFDYLLECYVPEKKRQYGYFSLPVLWDGQLVARMDCKADRRESHLHIYHLALEPSLQKIDDFSQALRKTLPAFMRFNNCTGLTIHKITPKFYFSAVEFSLA